MTSQGPFSVYHPDQVFTGRDWDAQIAGTLFAAAPKDVLLLGMGGGTVARQCRILYPRARIVAVEADAEIIRVARHHFALDTSDIEVMHTTAEVYVDSTRRKFDVIIDDAWPVVDVRTRAVCINDDWLVRLNQRLRQGGMVGINLYSALGDASTRMQVLHRLKCVFHCTREVRYEGRMTTVLVGGNSLLDGRQLRQVMQSLPTTTRTPLSKLQFRSV